VLNNSQRSSTNGLGQTVTLPCIPCTDNSCVRSSADEATIQRSVAQSGSVHGSMCARVSPFRCQATKAGQNMTHNMYAIAAVAMRPLGSASVATRHGVHAAIISFIHVPRGLSDRGSAAIRLTPTAVRRSLTDELMLT
jgi:hypothetical protein